MGGNGSRTGRPTAEEENVKIASIGALVVLAAAPLAAAAELHPVADDKGWCRESEERDPGLSFCEVREISLPSSGAIRVDASPNGGIDAQGSDRTDVRVRARVSARADDGSAREIAAAVKVEAGETIRATGPRGDRHASWSVTYKVSVPARSDLDLRSTNGGISISGVHGHVAFETMNGGVSLEKVGGDVRGRTTNGGLSVRLDGAAWRGSGLDVSTTNGGVEIEVPEGYNAHLETGTVNGHLRTDIPLVVKGDVGRRLSSDLGQGGATVRAVTTNGGVAIVSR
jgi:hypothetical protein